MAWPYHNHLRFFLLIPLYQAGAAFGYSGGIMLSLLSLFLFVPILPVQTPNAMFQFDSYSSIALLVLYTLFGVVVGGTVGEARKTHRYVEDLSGIFMELFAEPDERSVMLRSCEAAASLTEATRCAALVRHSVDGSSDWRITSPYDDEKHIPDSSPPQDNVLLWSVRNNTSLATNSAANDSRLSLDAPAHYLKSFMSIPVSYENDVYGAILLTDKKNGENFSEKDLEIAKTIAETSGDAIHNMVQEKNRQEEIMREERMRELFSRYVSSTVADYILEHPDLLAGNWKEITLLVSDIRGFTAMSEKIPAHELVTQLNEYFTAMVDVVFDNKGTIDKFIGDCIIAYWGAPAPDPMHAANAIKAAAAMARALETLNVSWAERGMPAYATGIAIHTCRVLMGNIGDERKKAFTIMGEEVEKAMSLEALTKNLDAKIIVSETASRASGVRLTSITGAPEEYGKLFTPISENA